MKEKFMNQVEKDFAIGFFMNGTEHGQQGGEIRRGRKRYE